MARFGREKKIKYLRKIPILQGCTRQQLLAVARISEIAEVPAGKPLAIAGEPGNEFFDGTARLEVPGRKRLRLGRGDFFGEMSLLDGEPGDPLSARLSSREVPAGLNIPPTRPFEESSRFSEQFSG